MKSVAKVNKYILNGRFKYISRFSVVGLTNTLVDFLMFTIFHELVGIGYMTSQILGYGFGIVNSFIFNKKWTFQDRKANKKILYEILQFVLVNLISLIVTVIIMKLLVHSLNINVYIAKVMVTLIAQITNFLGYKLMVFN